MYDIFWEIYDYMHFKIQILTGDRWLYYNFLESLTDENLLFENWMRISILTIHLF